MEQARPPTPRRPEVTLKTTRGWPLFEPTWPSLDRYGRQNSGSAIPSRWAQLFAMSQLKYFLGWAIVRKSGALETASVPGVRHRATTLKPHQRVVRHRDMKKPTLIVLMGLVVLLGIASCSSTKLPSVA